MSAPVKNLKLDLFLPDANMEHAKGLYPVGPLYLVRAKELEVQEVHHLSSVRRMVSFILLP